MNGTPFRSWDRKGVSVWRASSLEFIMNSVLWNKAVQSQSVMLAYAGIHRLGTWIPAGVYPREGGGGNDRNDTSIHTFLIRDNVYCSGFQFKRVRSFP